MTNVFQDKKTNVPQMFDSIAPRYDFLNHLLSFGLDYRWRKKALKLTNIAADAILLDVACGTGDFAIQAKRFGVKEIYGSDFSFQMLRHFNMKADWILGRNVQIAAENLPFKNESLTNITVAFGVRNFYDIPAAFASFFRVLKANGKVTILEFRLPKNKFLRFWYKLYFNNVLPAIGKLFSKNTYAYKYLPDSVEQFDAGVDVSALLKQAGFRSVEKYSLTFGTVQVLIAQK